jgi:hypothetical protein
MVPSAHAIQFSSKPPCVGQGMEDSGIGAICKALKKVSKGFQALGKSLGMAWFEIIRLLPPSSDKLCTPPIPAD